MSKPRIINVTFIEPWEDSDSDSNYVPSQTPESEDYSSLESSQYSVVESSSSSLE